MTPSLPERLRSFALVERNQHRDFKTADALEEAADELDRRAEEIQRLGYKLRRVAKIVGPPGAWPPDPEGIMRDTLRSFAPETIRVVEDVLAPPGLLIAVAPDGTVTVRRA